MDEQKINIIAKGDGESKVMITQSVNQTLLVDKTRDTYRTDDILSFLAYCKKFEENMVCGISGVLNYFGSISSDLTYKLEAWLSEIDYYSAPIAVLSLSINAKMKLFVDTINSPMSLSKAESFVKNFLNNGDCDLRLLDIIKFTRECAFSTITKFEQSKNNEGSFTLAVSREKNGEFKNSFPVETHFIIPCFSSPMIKFAPDFITTNIIDYETSNNKVEVSIKFECIGAKDLLVEAMSVFIREQVGELPNFFAGSLDVKRQTDESFRVYDPVNNGKV